MLFAFAGTPESSLAVGYYSYRSLKFLLHPNDLRPSDFENYTHGYSITVRTGLPSANVGDVVPDVPQTVRRKPRIFIYNFPFLCYTERKNVRHI